MSTIHPVKTKAEMTTVAALADEIWHQHFTPIIGKDQVDYMLTTFQSVGPIQQQIGEGAEYYCLFVDGDATGYFCLIPEPNSGKMLISKLYVRQATRGLGLGRKALAFIEDRACRQGLYTLRLTVNRHNTQTIRWYKHVGFETVGTQKKQIGAGFVMDDYLMEKTLPVAHG
jgi:GNAT superfamily N-acetyltransferase